MGDINSEMTTKWQHISRKIRSVRRYLVHSQVSSWEISVQRIYLCWNVSISLVLIIRSCFFPSVFRIGMKSIEITEIYVNLDKRMICLMLWSFVRSIPITWSGELHVCLPFKDIKFIDFIFLHIEINIVGCHLSSTMKIIENFGERCSHASWAKLEIFCQFELLKRRFVKKFPFISL